MTNTLHTPDGLTEVSLASHNSWALNQLFAPQNIRSNTSAVAISADTNTSSEIGLRLGTEGWSGIDHPNYQHIYAGQSFGHGERLLTTNVMSREVTIPVMSQPNYNRVLLDRILDFSNGAILAAFNRSNVSSSSYLIGCHSTPVFNRTRRGRSERSEFKIGLRSQWGYFVRPQTLGTGSAFVPPGPGKVIWGWRIPTPQPSQTYTVTMSGGELGAQRQWSWQGATTGAPTLRGNPTNLIAVFSPPFDGVYLTYNTGNLQDEVSAYRVSDTGVLPYLTPGQSYLLSTGGTLSNYTSSFFCLNNRLAP